MASNEIIILKDAYDKSGRKILLQPCRNPESGEYPDFIRPRDEHGKLILSSSDLEAQSKGKVYFIGTDDLIEIYHNKEFNLGNLKDAAEWEAIKYSRAIAKDRAERGTDGYLIDGPDSIVDEHGNAKGRLGAAEFYIYKPGKMAEARVKRDELIFKAKSLIFNNDSIEDMISKCKLLGRDGMERQSSYDIKAFLLREAGKDPNKIIDLYENPITNVIIVVTKAVEVGVVTRIRGLLYYGDTMLGKDIESAARMLAQDAYQAVYEEIKKAAYPEYEPVKKTARTNK